VRYPPDLTVRTQRGAEDSATELAVSDLLAEPARARPQWGLTAYRRILAASARPVAVGLPAGPPRERLEAAGWLTVGEASDLEEARQASWPISRELRSLRMDAMGSMAPRLLIIGERCPRPDSYPLASNKGGVYLFRALRDLGHDELTWLLANALDRQGKRRTEGLRALAEVVARYEPTVIGLGLEASRALTAAGVAHVRVEHPAAHLRFKSRSEGFSGYVRAIESAGVPRGSGIAPGALPTVAEPPDLPHPYDLSLHYAEPTDRGTRGKIDPVKAEVARAAFVGCEVDTLAAAALAAGIRDATEIRQLAAAEDWTGQRAERARRNAEAKLAERDRLALAEVRAQTNSRRLAWAATERALASVVERLQSGELKARPTDCKLLADAALALSERIMDPTEPDPALQGKSLRDLLVGLAAQVKEGLGGGVHGV
jgi:hypothetical protein